MTDMSPRPPALVDAVDAGLDLVRNGWRADDVDRRAVGDVLAVLVWVIDPSGAVAEQDLRTAAAGGIDLLRDPEEIRDQVASVFMDVLNRELSPVIRADLIAGADVEPLRREDELARWWRGAMYAIGSGDLEWVD